MCGICGKTGPAGCTETEIQKMLSAIRHRGPDDQGIFINEDFGFGHRRLSIIDLEGGHQPIANEDETLWIVFNGEIYNFQEIRQSFTKSHKFKTKSDTEVILHLYEEKGEECVKYLRGMFAFAIYDLTNKKLFIARDHLGQKPLYYFHNGQEFAFASEIKALLAFRPELREIDGNALYEYLTIRVITPPRSMFRRIRKLPPGHSLSFHDGSISIRRYWRLDYEPKFTGDEKDILDILDKNLRETVKLHLVSDVPVGAFLSGGLDSSLIVAMMCLVSGKSVQTFSGDISYKNYSELPHARLLADKYKTDHHELVIEPSLIRSLPRIVGHLDEPSDPLSVCMYSISEFARKEVKVVLGGDGGDELFGGYDRYYGNIFAGYYAMLPESIRKHILGNLLNILPEGFWYKSVSHKLRWMQQMSFARDGERYAKSLSYFYFSDQYKKLLYTDKFLEMVGAFDPEASIKNYFDSDNAKDVIDNMLYADSMTRMPDHPVMISDRMTMAHGLEVRSPFLDHKLAEFCAKIPSKFKIRGTRLRRIQVELAKRYLPPALINKKKQGFSSALTYTLDKEFRFLYKILLSDSHLARAEYIKKTFISKLLAEHFGRKADHGTRLWLICNAEIWYRMYIEDTREESIRTLFERNLREGK